MTIVRIRKEKKYALVVDIGGTNTVVGLGNLKGKILKKKKIKTLPESGPDFLFLKIINILKDFIKKFKLKKEDIQFSSIGSPGPLNLKKGSIIHSVNLVGWENFNLREPLETAFNVPAFIENDANLAGLGESWLGAGKGKKMVLAFTLGTGVGGAVIIHDRIFNGSKGYGAELGHITIDHDGPLCTCSNHGCLEAYISAGGILRRVFENEKALSKSILRKFSIETLTPFKVSLAAAKGDKYAIEILKETGRYLGIALASYTNIFNPDVIILGGGIMKDNKLVLNQAQKELRKRAFKIMSKDVKIALTKLGDTASLIGAVKNGLNLYYGNL